MGLDVLDITFRVEKDFGVRLPYEELEQLAHKGDIAVGDLYRLILRKIGLVDLTRDDTQLNDNLWREIQKTLVLATGVPADQVQLGTPLESLFPKPGRRELWKRFRESCSYSVCELAYPRAVRYVGLAMAAGVALIEQLQIWQIGIANWLWPFLGVVGLWMFSETYFKILAIFSAFRTAFPAHLCTVKDLCRTILGANYREVCERYSIKADPRCLEAWEKLVEILVAALGVDKNEIAFKSRLIKDLGME